MRILILALGTRGDLELFLLLARALQDRGHSVQMVTSEFHATRVLDHSIECLPVGSASAADLDECLASLVAEPDLRRRTRKYVEGFLQPELIAARQALESLAATSDYFVSNLKITIARNDAVLPTTFVTYDPPASLDELDRYTASLPRERILELVAFPKALLDPAGRWPQRFLFTGFWLGREQEQSLPEDVERFLLAGSPPVVLTTGSMRMFDGARLANIFAEALRQIDGRGILINASDRKASNSILHTGEAPYAALFPRVAAVIHHGGAGTTAEVLRAGKPSILLPQILAQRDMADCLANAGVSAGAFDPRTVSSDNLAMAIREAVNNAGFSEAATRVRKAIAEDSGVDSAATEIDRHWRTIANI